MNKKPKVMVFKRKHNLCIEKLAVSRDGKRTFRCCKIILLLLIYASFRSINKEECKNRCFSIILQSALKFGK